MKRLLALFLVLMFLVGALSACGGDEPVSSAPTNGTEANSSPSSWTDSTPTTSNQPSESGGSTPTTSNQPSESVGSTPTTSNQPSESVGSTLPTTGATTSQSDYGVNIVDFSITQPSETTMIDAAQFGMSTSLSDNSKAFIRAVAYMSVNPGTTLSIPKGVYYFDPSSRMSLLKITNGVIEGNGSEFIFTSENYFDIRECDTLKIQNLTIDWDWEKGTRLASLVKVKSISGKKVTFEFTEVSDASYAVSTPWNTFNQFDASSLTPGCANGKEFWELGSTVTNKKHLGGNQVSVTFSQAGAMKVGEVYLLRHYTYKSSVFHIGSSSQNITIKNVNIYSAYGSGVVAGADSHHFLLSGLTIGLRPGTENKYRISTTVDAIHIADTKGYFIIEDCDISFQGDDALNVHDNVGLLSSASGTAITVSTMRTENYNVGTTVAFKNASDFTDYSVTAKVVSKTVGNGRVTLTLDKAISGVPNGAVVYDTSHDSGNYIVRNNYFHENRARGLLLGSSNGLVENNRFYKTQGAAILIPVDIGSSWMEGTGVNNLMIRNNTFDTCNVNNWTPLIDFVTNINDTSLRGTCFTNVAIVDNTLLNFPSEAIDIECVQNMTVAGNTIKNDKNLSNGASGRGAIVASQYKALTIINNTWYKSSYMDSKVNEVVLIDRKPDMSQITTRKNELK